MFACFWVAVDPDGRCYVYREFCKDRLIVPDAAQEIHNNTLPGERIEITFAPPDMWSTQKTDGKTMAEGFMLADVAIVKVNNNRVQGHMQIKQMLADMPDGKPQLLIFDNCKHLIGDLPAIQTDENNPNDCAKEPHDISHTVDGLRYFCISRTMPSIVETERSRFVETEDGGTAEDYESAMTGGEPTASYIGR
jgi:phage terminase large subunit